MKRYGTVLLDADETLLDFRKSERDALQAAFEQSGLPTDGEFLQVYHRINDGLWERFNRGEIPKETVTGTRFVRLFAQFGIDRDGAAFNDFYLDRLSQFAYTLPGAEDLCRTLHTLGVRMYVATNGIDRVQKSRYGHCGLAQWMQGIFVSEEVGAGKPDKLFFDRVLHAVGDPPRSSVLMVGDSLTADIAGGTAAGIDTCWIDRSGSGTDSGATYTVRSLDELRRMFVSSFSLTENHSAYEGESIYGTDITEDH